MSTATSAAKLYIDDLQPLSGRLPIRVDLVEFQPPTLVATDFSRSAHSGYL